MHKRILIAAVAATLTSVPMFSSAATLSANGFELDVFGKLQAELSDIDIDAPNSGDPDPDSETAVRDNGVQSRIGFDVKKDVGGGGLAAIGRLEYTQVLGNGDSPGAREQWAGLKGGWGEFNAGRNQAPMKYIGGAAYDIFVATALQARGSGGAMWSPGTGYGAAGFVNHSIKYRSPKGSPVVVHALIMPSDSQNSAGGDSGGPGNGVDFNVGAGWGGELGEIIVGVSQDTANDAQELAGFDDDETVVRVGGKLKFGAFTLLAQYEDISDALTSGGVNADAATPDPGPTGLDFSDFSQQNACTGGSGFRGGDALFPNGVGQCNTAMNPGGDGEVYFVALHWKLGKWLLVAQGGKTEADATEAHPTSNPLFTIPALREREATNGTVGVVYFLDKTTRIYGGFQQVSVEEGPAASPTQEPDRESIALGIRLDF